MLALPSLKEGWGLVVGEAGMHRTPTVAYRSAGGTRESIAHERSGVLVEDPARVHCRRSAGCWRTTGRERASARARWR